jgi:hypothetical protein
VIKTFIDSGVLIAAARGQGAISLRAVEILDDPNREFVSSPFLKLEVLPKAIYNQRKDETRATELITTEKPDKSIHRTRSIQVISIYSL